MSWSIIYGKTTKFIVNPGSDKVFELKKEIEDSKKFLDEIKKGKSEAEKQPRCLVKPRITAQSKGELHIPAYKEFVTSLEQAEASSKPIVIFPSRDGKMIEMRGTPIGTFTSPAVHLPEFPLAEEGFENVAAKDTGAYFDDGCEFFRDLSDLYQIEALAHILFDENRNKYVIKIPNQELSQVSVHSTMETDYPDHLIHVMDIHSHNTMSAQFSSIDDKDEQATRLYAVIGHLDQLFPQITVRASCGGKFIPVKSEDVFETQIRAYPYPSEWKKQIDHRKNEKSSHTVLLPESLFPSDLTKFERYLRRVRRINDEIL